MTASERTYDEASELPVETASADVQEVLQQWVLERASWLKARALDLSVAPTALFQRVVIPPQRLLKAAYPRQLIQTLSDTGTLLRTHLTSLGRMDDVATPSAPPPVVDKMRTYWKARVDVLQKMLERKHSP